MLYYKGVKALIISVYLLLYTPKYADYLQMAKILSYELDLTFAKMCKWLIFICIYLRITKFEHCSSERDLPYSTLLFIVTSVTVKMAY